MSQAVRQVSHIQIREHVKPLLGLPNLRMAIWEPLLDAMGQFVCIQTYGSLQEFPICVFALASPAI